MQIKAFLRVITAGTFLALTYAGGNYYLYLSLLKAFPLINPYYIQLTVTFLAILYPLTELLRRFISIEPLLFVGAVYLGFLGTSLSTFILRDLLNIFIKLPSPSSYKISFYISVLITAYSLFKNYLPHRRKRIKITTNKLSRSLKIIFISDLHLCYLKSKKWLKKIVEKINQENPDFILIGGDLLDCTYRRAAKYLEIMKNLNSPVIAVPGNHDYFSNIEEVKKFYEKMEVEFLENRCIELKELIICGVADIMARYLGITKPNVENTICKADGKKFKIFLHHSPLLYKEAAECGTDLMLSGHTHAGQIPPMELIVFLYYYNPWGMKKWKNMLFYTSAGAGTWGPPMRFLSRNEIVVIELKNA